MFEWTLFQVLKLTVSNKGNNYKLTQQQKKKSSKSSYSIQITIHLLQMRNIRKLV